MKYAVCLQPYIPMRAEAAEQSEMTSQLIFGDTFRIEEEIPRWYRIVRDCDNYEGWIDWKTATIIDKIEYNRYIDQASDAPLLRLPFNPVQRTDQGQSGPAQFSWGSRIFGLDETGITFRMHGIRFDVPSMSYVQPMHGSSMSRKALAKYVMQQAQMLLNTPYLWGGTTAFGLDCSGFTQTLFRFIGISLARNASQQALQGKAVAYEAAEVGDLAFFTTDPETQKISHVGLVADNNRILHVSGYLHYDELRPEGIWCIARKEHTHYLVSIKRYFSGRDLHPHHILLLTK